MTPPADRPQPTVGDDEILPMLPPCDGLGIWTVTLTNTLNLATPGRCLKPRLIYDALVRMEGCGLVFRDGRPASYLFTGWVLAKTQA